MNYCVQHYHLVIQLHGFDVFHPDKLYVDFVKDMGFNVVKV